MKSIYYRSPYIQILVNDFKIPLRKEMGVLFAHKGSMIAKARAFQRLKKLVPVIRSLPKPTVGNTVQPGSHILIDIRDRFFCRLKLGAMNEYLETCINLLIIINETDVYRPFITWWVWELKKSDWPPLGPRQPDHHLFSKE